MPHTDGENKIDHCFLIRNYAMTSERSEAGKPALYTQGKDNIFQIIRNKIEPT